MKLYKCKENLVGTMFPISQDPMNKNCANTICGCNNLFCNYCKMPVRSWAGYIFTGKYDSYKIEELYNSDDLDALHTVRKNDDDRLYSCLCWADTITAFDRLGPYEGICSWECGGHPVETDNT